MHKGGLMTCGCPSYHSSRRQDEAPECLAQAPQQFISEPESQSQLLTRFPSNPRFCLCPQISLPSPIQVEAHYQARKFSPRTQSPRDMECQQKQRQQCVEAKLPDGTPLSRLSLRPEGAEWGRVPPDWRQPPVPAASILLKVPLFSSAVV